ncbi:hypothetical protein BKA70DRAFT_1370781 [Coprinopsis sp. MPI-PUGE-AT-0042]|nr:hypothetical protein BKA70DRAFT_1370781 [Coprinopsis sp. MPI-PUGE-AT-0042]
MSFKLAALATIVAAALVLPGAATPVALNEGIVTNEELDHWIATTDAKLTFVGSNERSGVGIQAIRVVYCNRRTNNVCGGACTIYDGGNRCLAAPGTQCLSATGNVSFCNRGGCGGACSAFNECITRLENNFCWTPGTASINVPFT